MEKSSGSSLVNTPKKPKICHKRYIQNVEHTLSALSMYFVQATGFAQNPSFNEKSHAL